MSHLVRLSTIPTNWYEVEVPVDGEVVRIPFLFRQLTTDEAAKQTNIRIRLTGSIIGANPSKALQLLLERTTPEEIGAMKDLLRGHILNWKGIGNEQDEAIEFSREALEDLINRAAFVHPLWSALIDASTGKGLKKTEMSG